ncbi:hypothetical protein FB001_1743 [Ensifer sp. SEMIA 135]|nr:hypothetical protein FB000_1695 [Ensifer sp. SEMIA 134]TWB21630.1 hypothetical protein FB001_1743 [Ensifer sp. SEMIA 135]
MSFRGLSKRENIPTSATNVAAITRPTPLKACRLMTVRASDQV